MKKEEITRMQEGQELYNKILITKDKICALTILPAYSISFYDEKGRYVTKLCGEDAKKASQSILELLIKTKEELEKKFDEL